MKSRIYLNLFVLFYRWECHIESECVLKELEVMRLPMLSLIGPLLVVLGEGVMVEEGATIEVEAMEERSGKPMSQALKRVWSGWQWTFGKSTDLRNSGRTYGESSGGRSLIPCRAYSTRLEATSASERS